MKNDDEKRESGKLDATSAKESAGPLKQVKVDVGVDIGSTRTKTTAAVPPNPNNEHTRTEYGASRKPTSPASDADHESRSAPRQPLTERLSENAAATLSYAAGWVTGVVFLMIDRRPYVRYHAAQSVVVFATLSIVFLFLGNFFLAKFLAGDVAGGVLLMLRRLVELSWLAIALLLMLKAASGERFRIPIAAKYADVAARGSHAEPAEDRRAVDRGTVRSPRLGRP